MKYQIFQRHECRLCGSKEVRRFLHSEAVPVFDDLIPQAAIGSEFLAPIDVYWCATCKSVQTQHDIQMGDYYQEYHYVASESAFIRDFMHTLARVAFERFELEAGDRVIEIGSADGYQLACFQELGAQVLGFEPSIGLSKLSEARAIPVVTTLFGANTIHTIPPALRPTQVVLLTHTFDHLPDPVAFLQAVGEVLDPVRGILLIEVHDLKKIIERRETGLLAHEHATYLHAVTMQRLLERNGFTLLSIDLIAEEQRRGNSMLLAAALQGSIYTPDLQLDMGDYAFLDEWSTYQNFSAEVETSYEKLRGYVRGQVAGGRRLAAYGAWGRGATTLALTNLTHADFEYICDRNQRFHGLYTPKSHIPVVPPERLFTDPVDEVIVFAYGYMEEIKRQLAPFVDRGGKLTRFIDLL